MAMTPTETSASREDAIDATAPAWPLKFKRHSFGGYCFDTIGCRISYDGLTHGAARDDQISSSLESRQATLEQIVGSMHISRKNFPPPAHVRWRSKDGVSHDAEVDIGAIFADELILHRVTREDLGSGTVADPGIILVVEDRTISVYMRAFLSTKSLQIHGNPHSNARSDLILAWSRTY